MENLTFETALKGLRESADKINISNGTLEDALKAYKEGMEYYKYCNQILEESVQKIEVIEK